MAVQIKKIQFDGLEAVEIVTSKVRLIAVTSMGPRIAHFGPRNGNNLLFWDYPRKFHRGDWHLMGGHRIWAMRPDADEAEETYSGDNHPCTVKITARGVDIQGTIDPAFKTRKSIGIKVLSDDTLRIENRITNVSEMLWSGGIWSLTCTLPTARTNYGIPLGREGEWDIFVIGYPKRWGGGQFAPINDKGVRMTENCMTFAPQNHVSKRMVQAPQGIIGMTEPKDKLSFIKKTPFYDGAAYPMGCNIAFYAGKNKFMVEMEAMGPSQTVLPGATISLEETWTLRGAVDWGKLQGVYKD